MPLAERQRIFERIESKRQGRTLICFFNFDRPSTPPVPGLHTQFAADTKEPLFRVLKDSLKGARKIDLCLYTRGGDTNSVWPVASLIREFDPDFEVLVPFRCHSSGTLLALGARRIVLTTLSELSPIDPSTGNQFNPLDPIEKRNRLAISVEDVSAYRQFALKQLGIEEEEPKETAIGNALLPFFSKLIDEVHPLALGNVQRVHNQIKLLAERLLKMHSSANADRVVEQFTTQFYSHLHMINRHEAKSILGDDRVTFADSELDALLDTLLHEYENHFNLRQTFFLNSYLGDKSSDEVRFIGGAIESRARSYLFETRAIARQTIKLPANVQMQVAPGQEVPLIPGYPREFAVEITSQGWVYNPEPKGFTR